MKEVRNPMIVAITSLQAARQDRRQQEGTGGSKKGQEAARRDRGQQDGTVGGKKGQEVVRQERRGQNLITIILYVLRKCWSYFSLSYLVVMVRELEVHTSCVDVSFLPENITARQHQTTS